MADHSGLDGLGGNGGTGGVLVGFGELVGTGGDPGGCGIHGSGTCRPVLARERSVMRGGEAYGHRN